VTTFLHPTGSIAGLAVIGAVVFEAALAVAWHYAKAFPEPTVWFSLFFVRVSVAFGLLATAFLIAEPIRFRTKHLRRVHIYPVHQRESSVNWRRCHPSRTSHDASRAVPSLLSSLSPPRRGDRMTAGLRSHVDTNRSTFRARFTCSPSRKDAQTCCAEPLHDAIAA